MELEGVLGVKEEPFISDEDGYDLPETEVNGLGKQGAAAKSTRFGDQRMSITEIPDAGIKPRASPCYTQIQNVGGIGKRKKVKQQYDCKSCKHKFTSKAWLMKHEKMHEKMENKSKLYKCEICSKEFTQRIIYLDHKAAHAGLRPYVCDRCGMDFTWYRAFHRHQRNHETGGKAFSCHLCNRTFNSNWNLARHLEKIHMSKQIFKCNVCSEIFEKKNLFLIHMKAHDREMKKRNGIIDEKILKKHRYISNLVKNMLKSQTSKSNVKENLLDPADVRKYQGSEISENGRDIVSTTDEKDQCSDKNLELEKKDTTIPASEQTKNVTSENKIIEEQKQGPMHMNGKQKRDTRKTKILHMETELLSKTEKDTIDVSYPMFKNQPYECDICGKSVYNLDAHLRIHSGDKPFSCYMCGKDFAQREALKIHYRSHTGEKPFVCTTCGKSFATRGLQQDHMRAHRGDKPYQCDVCDAKFSWRCALSRHKQLHSSGPKPHICSVCDFGCWRKTDLMKHEKTHLYDKLYCCDFENCTEKFTNKKHLAKHKKNHQVLEGPSSGNGRVILTRKQTANIGKIDDTTPLEALNDLNRDKNIPFSLILKEDIKKEPDTEDNDLQNKMDIQADMFITCNDGITETVITQNSVQGSGKQDMESSCPVSPFLYENQNSNQKTHNMIQDVDLSSNILAEESQNDKDNDCSEKGFSGNEDNPQSSFQFKENQVVISMDDVVAKTVQGVMNADDILEPTNSQVRCEVCDKLLNISYYHIHVRKHLEETAHVCELCNKSFSRKTDLIVHSRVHTNIRPFKCSMCPKAFKVKSLLEDHIRAHDGTKPYVCSLCDASFAWRCALHRHVKTHSPEGPHKCDRCGKDFHRRRDWKTHIDRGNCKFGKSIVYKCNDCQAVFINLETLVYHNDKYHKTNAHLSCDDTCEMQASLTLSDEPLNTSEQEQTTNENASRGDCEISHVKTIQLDSNIRELRHDVEIDENDESTGVQRLEEDGQDDVDSTNSNNEDELPVETVCKMKQELITNSFERNKHGDLNCDEQFVGSVKGTDTSLQQHTSAETDEEVINDNFPASSPLIPGSVDPSSIDWSGKNLTYPCPSSPSGKEPDSDEMLKCRICGRSFVSKIGLKIHLRIHSKDAMDIYALHFRQKEAVSATENKPITENCKYKCRLCNKSFPFASGLRIHMMAHSGKTPYPCKVCGKKFPYLESVKTHMRVHTGERPFTCDVCGKSFAYRHSHDDHYRTHTGDKPYKCDKCGSTFTWKSALHRHHKTHSLESLEYCSICKAKFKNGGQLIRHMNRFHSSLV